MKATLLLALVFFQGTLVTPAEAGKGSPRTPRITRERDDRVAALRSDRSQGSGAANRRDVSTVERKPTDEAGAPRPSAGQGRAAAPPVVNSVQTHPVKRGETLEGVASGYDTTTEVLVALNGIESGESIRAGQILFVPRRDRGTSAKSEPVSVTWRRYLKAPKEKGLVDVSTHTARFVGQVMDKAGRLRPEAVRALNGLLGASGKHPPLPERLIRLLVKVSDTFGGRAIHVVDGYRTSSYYQDSRHKLSAAVDFTMAGVPNAILCDYLRALDDVGVGYYPNSTFVHLDVRNHSAYWVDYAGPGEPPRSSPSRPRRSHGMKRMLLAQLEAQGEDAKHAIERNANALSSNFPTPTLPDLERPASEREQTGALRDGIDQSQRPREPLTM